MKIYQNKKKFEKLNKKDLKDNLFKFYQIYKKKPIKNNSGGMLFGKMFALYYLLKKNSQLFHWMYI